MKSRIQSIHGWSTYGRRLIIAGIAMAACLGFAVSAQAQCVVSNWAGATNLADGNAGNQGSSNRRYGGPCGLRVAVDGSTRFLTDNSPTSEGTYIARFYAFLDNAGSNPVLLFAADDGTDQQIQVFYDNGDLTLKVWDQASSDHDLNVTGVGSGWHSIELVWEEAADADIRFSVDGDTDVTPGSVIDTTGIAIANAHLGNVNGAGGGGSIDFDDFDSRRVERPGRLVRADANDDGVVDIFDAVDLRDELAETSFAPGQPDCDENGEVDIFDAPCLRDLVL